MQLWTRAYTFIICAVCLLGVFYLFTSSVARHFVFVSFWSFRLLINNSFVVYSQSPIVMMSEEYVRQYFPLFINCSSIFFFFHYLLSIYLVSSDTLFFYWCFLFFFFFFCFPIRLYFSHTGISHLLNSVHFCHPIFWLFNCLSVNVLPECASESTEQKRKQWKKTKEWNKKTMLKTTIKWKLVYTWVIVIGVVSAAICYYYSVDGPEHECNCILTHKIVCIETHKYRFSLPLILPEFFPKKIAFFFLLAWICYSIYSLFEVYFNNM